jgi:hypothetical protein
LAYISDEQALKTLGSIDENDKGKNNLLKQTIATRNPPECTAVNNKTSSNLQFVVSLVHPKNKQKLFQYCVI